MGALSSPCEESQYLVHLPSMGPVEMGGTLSGPKMIKKRQKKREAEEADRNWVYGFSAQYDQTPIPRGGGEFKIDHIILDERG